MENKKSNVGLALLLSFLTTLVGSMVFGLVYAIGYYIYFLAVAEIMLACNVFLKKSKANKKNIALAIIWTVVWTFIFNLLAIIICEIYWIASEFNINFSSAFKTLIDAWKVNPELKSYMNTRVLQVAGMIVLGCAIYGTYYIIQLNKNLKHNHTVENNVQTTNTSSTEQTKSEIINKDINSEKQHLLISDCKKALLNYSKDANNETLKNEITKIKENHISHMSEDEKQKLIEQLSNKQKEENLSKLEEKAIKMLLKILN